jgi:competence protein ComEC
MKFGVPLCAGIILGWEWSVPVWAPIVLAALLGALALAHARSPLAAWFFAAAVLSAGAAKITADARLYEPADVGRAARGGPRVVLAGRVSELPRSYPRSVRVVVDAESLRSGSRAWRASGRVLLSAVRGSAADSVLSRATYGTRLVAAGRLTIPGGPRNPGEFDRGASLRLNDITAEMALARRDTAAAAPALGDATLLERFVYPARRSVNGVLARYFRGEAAQFLKGLITGERSEIAPELKSAFITAGVMHIIAVSGLHVVIVTLMLSFLLEMLRIPEKPRLLLLGAILAYYTFFTGATASVARSVLMALVMLWAPGAERKADIYNALAASALVILLVDARQLFQPGFQLSYAAVFALVYLSPKVQALARFVPERVRRWKAARLIGEGLAVSVAAGVGTIPFGAYYFGKISLSGFLANLVIVPLSNVVLCLGMLTVAAAYVWGWLAGVYAGAASLATWLLLRAVEFFARLPYAAIQGRFGTGFFLAVYGALAFLLNAARADRRPRALLLALAGVNAALWWGIATERPPELSVTLIDVGQGDAILVRFPHGGAMLVDAGPRSAAFDAGERTVVPFLSWAGVDRLDAVVVTHPHSDHLGGMAALLRRVKVGRVVEPGTALGGSIYREFARVSDSLGVPRVRPRSGDTLALGGAEARVYVLAPGAGGDDPPASGDSLDNHALNNCSVVLRIVYGRTSILLSGDAEEAVEGALVERFGGFLRSGILKTGHHGSRTSSSPGYLRAVAPSAALVSVGERNTFGHPSPEVIARLGASGIRVLRTDREGAVVLSSDGRAWRELPWRDGPEVESLSLFAYFAPHHDAHTLEEHR